MGDEGPKVSHSIPVFSAKTVCIVLSIAVELFVATRPHAPMKSFIHVLTTLSAQHSGDEMSARAESHTRPIRLHAPES